MQVIHRRRWPWAGIIGGVVILMLAGPSLGMPPLAQVQADNLAAAEILIGRVVKVGPDPASPPGPGPAGGKPAWDRFALGIIHVVKSRQGSQPGDRVEVRFLRDADSPLASGPVPVQVAAGDLVIVYANPAEGAQGLLAPVCAGFSVVRLSPRPQENQAVPFPQPR